MNDYPKSCHEAALPVAYDPETALGRVVIAIAELNEQLRCVTCGKPFTESAASIDRCARCAGDMLASRGLK